MMGRKYLAPADAMRHQCCMMNRNCLADQCMAWTQQVVVDKEKQSSPHDLKLKETGLGYCGMLPKR